MSCISELIFHYIFTEYPNLISESKTVVEDYMKKRRRIIPQTYYTSRKYVKRQTRERPNQQPNLAVNLQENAMDVQLQNEEPIANDLSSQESAVAQAAQTIATFQHKAIQVPESNEMNLREPIETIQGANMVINEPFRSEEEEATTSRELFDVQSQQNTPMELIRVAEQIEMNSQPADSVIQILKIGGYATATVNREPAIVQSPQRDATGQRLVIQVGSELNQNIGDAAANGKLVDDPHIRDQDLLCAKQEQEIENLRKAVIYLNGRLGVEDLTVQKMIEHGNMLLSSGDESGDSEDEDEENVPQNMQNVILTDMTFSFSHQYILNVRRILGI